MIGVCLYGKTDDVRHLGEGLIKNAEVTFQRRQAVDISRRADFLRDALERARPQRTFLRCGIQNDSSGTSCNFDFIGRLAQGTVPQLRRDTIPVSHLWLNFFIDKPVLLLFDKFLSIFDVHRRQRPIGHRAIRCSVGESSLRKMTKLDQIFQCAAVDILVSAGSRSEPRRRAPDAPSDF